MSLKTTTGCPTCDAVSWSSEESRIKEHDATGGHRAENEVRRATFEELIRKADAKIEAASKSFSLIDAALKPLHQTTPWYTGVIEVALKVALRKCTVCGHQGEEDSMADLSLGRCPDTEVVWLCHDDYGRALTAIRELRPLPQGHTRKR